MGILTKVDLQGKAATEETEGIVIDNAYIKVGKVTADIIVYESEADRIANKNPIKSFQEYIDVDSSTYDKITDGLYPDSVDVLDDSWKEVVIEEVEEPVKEIVEPVS